MKTWDVWVCRAGRTVAVGQVFERSEPLARCAALARFGVSEEEIAAGEVRSGKIAIYPD